MKKISSIVSSLAIVCVLQACDSFSKKAGTNTDTSSSVQDTSTKINLVIDNDDKKFALEAASGGIAEVELGKLAIQNGRSKKVKNFGAMMVKDHGRANARLMALAKSKGLSLPTIPDADAQKIIDELSKKSGSDFDGAYINDMITDHQQDIKAFKDASTKCEDPDLKAFAAKTLPVLQKHLDAITAIHDSMK